MEENEWSRSFNKPKTMKWSTHRATSRKTYELLDCRATWPPGFHLIVEAPKLFAPFLNVVPSMGERLRIALMDLFLAVGIVVLLLGSSGSGGTTIVPAGSSCGSSIATMEGGTGWNGGGGGVGWCKSGWKQWKRPGFGAKIVVECTNVQAPGGFFGWAGRVGFRHGGGPNVRKLPSPMFGNDWWDFKHPDWSGQICWPALDGKKCPDNPVWTFRGDLVNRVGISLRCRQ